MNPRVLAWLDAHGLPADAIARRCGDDVPRVSLNGDVNVWTVHYSKWIHERWQEWAATLGFYGDYAWRNALLAGNRDEAFDAWLQDWLRKSRCPVCEQRTTLIMTIIGKRCPECAAKAGLSP